MTQEPLAALKKTRASLLILLATCRETSLALAATANVLDTSMEDDLNRMIERTQAEIREISSKIERAAS